MLEISLRTLDRLKELAFPLSSDYLFGDYFDKGIQSSTFVFPDGYKSRDIDDIVNRLGAKLLYITNGRGGIDKVFLFTYNGCVGFMYTSTRFPGWPTGHLYVAFRITGRDFYIVYETLEEATIAVKIEALNDIKKQLSDTNHFLEDPWREYNSKKIRYEEKLKKVEGATKVKIESEKKKKKELEEKVKSLETDIIGALGVENK